MTRHEAWWGLVRVACGVLALGCYDASDEPQAGGHTNWLTCERLSDCAQSTRAVACGAGYCLDDEGERIARDASAPSPKPSAGSGAESPMKPKPRTLDEVALDATVEGEVYSQIWGSSDDDVWVLGGPEPEPVDPTMEPVQMPLGLPCNVGKPQPTSPMFFRHFDGQAWTRSELEAPALFGLHGSDPENVWAVGSRTVLRLQGTQWVEQDIADATKHEPMDPCYEEVSLWSVFARAADDVWAVGYIFPSELGPGLILHFDGTQWSRMPVDAGDGFFAVWAAAEDDAWAMGSSGLTYHYDGEQWRRVDVGTEQYLWSIWGSAGDDVWASGNGGALLHYDGDRWQSVASPVAREQRSLTGRAPDDIWNLTQPGSGNEQSLLHWDGTSWNDTPVASGEYIEKIWLSPSGKLWSAGSRLARRN